LVRYPFLPSLSFLSIDQFSSPSGTNIRQGNASVNVFVTSDRTQKLFGYVKDGDAETLYPNATEVFYPLAGVKIDVSFYGYSCSALSTTTDSRGYYQIITSIPVDQGLYSTTLNYSYPGYRPQDLFTDLGQSAAFFVLSSFFNPVLLFFFCFVN
jgi:hypothetical protein